MLGFMKKVVVSDHERVLLFRDRQFQKVLTPGVYRFLDGFHQFSFDVIGVSRAGIRHDQLDLLIMQPEFAKLVDVYRMKDNEVGVVYVEGKPETILKPGSRWVTWKGVLDVEVKTHALDELKELDSPCCPPCCGKGWTGPVASGSSIMPWCLTVTWAFCSRTVAW